MPNIGPTCPGCGKDAPLRLLLWGLGKPYECKRCGTRQVVAKGHGFTLAMAAFVAYLSSIVAKGYSAVQYALLSSLTLLVGTLGRGALGQMIEEQGYYSVFILTTLIGLGAVVLCVIEWIRQARLGKAAGVVAPEAGDADHEVAAGA